MRLAPALLLSLLVSLPAAAACTLAVSTSGLAGPPLELEADDAASDGPARPEGGSEAGAGDADAGGYCAQHAGATFCFDFDHASSPTEGFSSTSFRGNLRSLSLVTDSISAPNALLAHVGAGSGPNVESSARVYRDFGFVARTVHLELDTKLCRTDADFHEFLKLETSSASLQAVMPGFESADVALANAGAKTALSLEYYTGDSMNPVGGGGTLLDQPLPLERWTHLAIDIVFSQQENGSIVLHVDGATKPSVSRQNLRTLSAAPSAMRLLVGTFTNNSSDGCSNLFDNVLVEAAP